MREHIQAEVQFALQSARQSWQAEQDVAKDYQDPELGPLLKEHQDEMNTVMEKLGNTDEAYEVARHMLRLYGQNQAMAKKLAEQSQQTGAVEAKAKEVAAKQAAIKHRAGSVISADPKAPPQRSVWDEAREWADKNGHSTDSAAFIQHVSKLTQQRFNK